LFGKIRATKILGRTNIYLEIVKNPLNYLFIIFPMKASKGVMGFDLGLLTPYLWQKRTTTPG
jgi:hypothetical protein